MSHKKIGFTLTERFKVMSHKKIGFTLIELFKVMLHKKIGFTLIELMIVVIIVGILSAVAIPLMRGNVARAKKTECVAALGTIRTAERMYYAEYNSYCAAGNLGNTSTPLNAYLRAGDLNGKYFNDFCYSVDAAATTFSANCNTNMNATVNLYNVAINETGTITNG